MMGKFWGCVKTSGLTLYGLIGLRSEELSRLLVVGSALHRFGVRFGISVSCLALVRDANRICLWSSARLGSHRFEAAAPLRAGLGSRCILEGRFGSVGFPFTFISVGYLDCVE